MPKIDGLLKIISLILTIIIVLAILKKSIYYSAFNIKLTDYLDFSEALLIFFKDVLFTTLIIFFLVIFSIFIPSREQDPKIDYLLFTGI